MADDVPEPGDGGSPVYLGSGRRAERASATGCPVPLMGQGCSVRRLSSTVQGVFHRLVVREGGTGPGKRRWRLLLVPRACARAVGMGLGVESSGGPAGLPWVFGSSLVVRVGDWPFKGEYSTCVQVWSRGSCHIWGTWLDAAETDGEFSRRSGRFANRPYGRGESRLSRGCAFRRDGFLPPQERRMGVAVWGRPPLDPSIRLSRLTAMLRVSGPSQGWIHGRGASSIGGWHACRRLSAGMTEGEWGGGCGDLNGLCPVEAGLPLDPSIPPKVSGPTLGMDSRLGASSTGSGAGMTVMQRSHRERRSGLGGLT